VFLSRVSATTLSSTWARAAFYLPQQQQKMHLHLQSQHPWPLHPAGHLHIPPLPSTAGHVIVVDQCFNTSPSLITHLTQRRRILTVHNVIFFLQQPCIRRVTVRTGHYGNYCHLSSFVGTCRVRLLAITILTLTVTSYTGHRFITSPLDK